MRTGCPGYIGKKRKTENCHKNEHKKMCPKEITFSESNLLLTGMGTKANSFPIVFKQKEEDYRLQRIFM